MRFPSFGWWELRTSGQNRFVHIQTKPRLFDRPFYFFATGFWAEQACPSNVAQIGIATMESRCASVRSVYFNGRIEQTLKLEANHSNFNVMFSCLLKNVQVLVHFEIPNSMKKIVVHILRLVLIRGHLYFTWNLPLKPCSHIHFFFQKNHRHRR